MAKKPATPEAEAETSLPEASVPEPGPEALVVFESREEEASKFEVAGYEASKLMNTNRLEWYVPESDVARFVTHYHVQTGRVVRKVSTYPTEQVGSD